MMSQKAASTRMTPILYVLIIKIVQISSRAIETVNSCVFLKQLHGTP